MTSVMPAPALSSRYAALYVDGPNVLTNNKDGRRIRYVASQLDWRALITEMLSTVDPELCIVAGSLYLFRLDSDDLRRDVAGVGRQLGPNYRAAVQVIGAQKDVDARIVSDMWPDVLAFRKRALEERPGEPCEVTILLAGGDHIYAHAITRMRESLAHLRISIRVHTFSWKENLSGHLSGISAEVVYLDNLPILRSFS